MDEIGSLLEVLRLARAEGALEGEGLLAFAEGLRERAEVVIAERLAGAEAQVRRLEDENAWRRETIAGHERAIRGLEQEIAWRRETIRELEQENAWRRETIAAQEADLRGLRAQRDAAADAHDRLLAHHRDVIGRVAAELAAVAALPIYSLRSARRRLVSLALAIRGEIE
jgi:hypothetical protein